MWVSSYTDNVMEESDFDKWRKQLGLFEDDNHIWRCRGRLENADIAYSTEHPYGVPSVQKIMLT